MIMLSVERSEGHVVRFRVRGHSGQGVAGNDVVCAGVSALAISAVNGLEEHAGVSGSVSEHDGLLEYTLTRCDSAEARVKADAILETMISGIRAIAREYPGSVHVID